MPRFLVYDSWEELEGLRSGWARLVRAYPLGSTCMTWEWLTSWWSSYGAGRQLKVFALLESDRLVGLAPLATATHRVWKVLRLRALDFLGDGSWDSDHLDAPVLPEYVDHFANELLNALSTMRWDICRLNLIPSKSWLGRTLPAHLSRRGWPLSHYLSPTSAIALPGSWPQYLEELAPAQRAHLRRYGGRLVRRFSVKFQRCLTPQELEWGLECLFALHQLRRRKLGQQGSFSLAARRHFYRRLAPQLLELGLLHLWVLQLDGRPVAAQFAFRHKATVFQLQEGFDPRFTSDRPGTVLRAHILGRLIEEGVESYDYLGGFDSEKARWGARLQWYHRLHFARPDSLGAFYLATKRFATRWTQRLAGLPDLRRPDATILATRAELGGSLERLQTVE